MKKISPTVARTILIGIIVAVIGYIGFDVSPATVEQLLDEQFPVQETLIENKAVTQTTFVGVVSSVIDGDTLILKTSSGEETVRMIGINAPETEFSPAGAQCYGAESSVFAKDILEDESVIVTLDATQGERDRFDRLLGYVEVQGEDFGEIILREGYAREYTYDAVYKNQTLYRVAQSEARIRGVGLWTACE